MSSLLAVKCLERISDGGVWEAKAEQKDSEAVRRNFLVVEDIFKFVWMCWGVDIVNLLVLELCWFSV